MLIALRFHDAPTSGDVDLTVRRFTIDERLDGLFTITVVARSSDEDLDLDGLVGRGASVRLELDSPGARAWTGVVSRLEQIEIEPSGLSTYELTIVPALWRTTQRKNSRVFQHKSALEIATALLADWAIVPLVALDPKAFPRLEYKVQYSETDFAFLSRILEEAGIGYFFRDAGPNGDATSLVLSADATKNDPRARGLLRWFNGDEHPSPDAIWGVRLRREVRPGRVTVRDFDFRSRPDAPLLSEKRSGDAVEDRLEIFDYRPGAFLIEPDGAVASAPEQHVARSDRREADARAERHLAHAQHRRRVVGYRTNAIDLAPGVVFAIEGHPRGDLRRERTLLVTHHSIRGSIDGALEISGEAVFADEPHRPPQLTPRPSIAGLQSALVVGPSGHEIHTDELGRVRVQFHWDRYGARDHESSCFVRVSQSWAGAGHGSVTLPRVGDEVLVGFYEGDPDQPVVVGRLFNGAAYPPHKLPANKTRSSWMGRSSPEGDGHNEIMFEDARGGERVYVHAEKDFERVVKADEIATVGGDARDTIGRDETREVKRNQTERVGGDRSVSVEGNDSIAVGESFRVDLGGGAGVAVHKEKRIVLTTGEASIVLDGPNLYVDAQSTIRFAGGDLLAFAGGEVQIDGRPNVFLNSGSASLPMIASAAAAIAAATIDATELAVEAAFDDAISGLVDAPGAMPDAIAAPKFVEAQLASARDRVLRGALQIEDRLKSRAEMIEDELRMKLKKLGENVVPKVEAARAEINAAISRVRVLVEKAKAEVAARVAQIEAEAKQIRARVEATIATVKEKAAELRARVDAAVKSIEDRVQQIKEQYRKALEDIKARVQDIIKDVKGGFDDLRKRALDAIHQGEEIVNEVKAAIVQAKQAFHDVVNVVKQTIDDVKIEIKQAVQAVKDQIQAVKNDVKQIAGEIKGEIQDLKHEAKEIGAEVKSDAKAFKKELKQDIQRTKDEAKGTAKELKGEAKQATDELKQEGKSLKQDGTSAFDAAKSTFRDHHKPGNGGGDARTERPAVVTRAGAFSGDHFADAVNSTSGATFLQSPSEGQLMIVRTKAAGASPLDGASLSRDVVEHQMQGLSSEDAYATALQSAGYAVYERPWEATAGEFVLKALV